MASKLDPSWTKTTNAGSEEDLDHNMANNTVNESSGQTSSSSTPLTGHAQHQKRVQIKVHRSKTEREVEFEFKVLNIQFPFISKL